MATIHVHITHIDIDVWVEPTVVITAVNDTICNNTATGILPVSGQTTTNGIRYTWTVADNPDITGESGSTGNGQLLGTQIIQTLNNTSNTAQKVTYRITPNTIGSNGNSCPYNFADIDIWIDPTPIIFPLPVTSPQCDSTATNIKLTSPTTFTSGLITFRYTVSTTGSVTGYFPSAGLPNNHTITDVLVNQTDHYQVVTYQVVPVSPRSCADGLANDFSVTVNPTPRVIPINGNLKPDSSICFRGTITDYPHFPNCYDIRFNKV